MTKTTLDWEWPFSLADITAGLRRYFEDTSLRVIQIRPKTMPYRRPAIGRVRAMRVEYSTSTGSGTCDLVVKEPRGTTRTGLAGAGRREVGVYRSLTSHLPLPTPTLIAASPIGDWLLLEALQSVRDPSYWKKEDYVVAIEALTRLHDRFWGLETDLTVFQWLSRPIRADFEVHVAAAAKAIERIVNQAQPEPLATVPERMQVLAALTMQADQIVTPLLKQPSTLLHGDYWPGNIAVLEDGRQVVYDWQLTGVGPGVIDLLVFINKSSWWFDKLPISQEEIVECYRQGMAAGPRVTWEEDEWNLIWDHALMWRFLQEWVDLLAVSPDPLLETRADQLDHVWLHPVASAVSRRLVTD
ncbi:MAG: aminoglycoside phosphotransferase family protein [Anaerolineaceae bacterium]|nr:MAG: aminoglycoside phosphotransferase family protein [Anaerolineaceae bacterium]